MSAVLLTSALLLLAFLSWLLIVAEGSYLGSRAVVFLYDRAAGAYDTVKARSARHDRRRVALPLARALSDVAHPLVLDVATGTGRVPLLLADWPFFGGHIIGLDLSSNMLDQAKQRTREFRDVISLTRQDALFLSFADNTFDAVSCLEGLELFPRSDKALQEMARVLRPGGVLLISNRVGWQAKLLPGRTYDASRLQAILHSLSLEEVRVEGWQRSYDLVWAVKMASVAPAAPPAPQYWGE
ncbi:MAG: class I SAM-dependent methyltransferase [Anaerolineales bacterium]|nr:class I SAM-dependent methyltransferase [Anaerolineales bacterium]